MNCCKRGSLQLCSNLIVVVVVVDDDDVAVVVDDVVVVACLFILFVQSVFISIWSPVVIGYTDL